MFLQQSEARLLETDVVVLIDGIETTTSCPSASSRLATWKPMKPTAPVTRIRMKVIVAKGERGDVRVP